MKTHIEWNHRFLKHLILAKETNSYLSLYRDWTFENAVHAKNGTLRWIDNRCAHQWTEYTSIADGESATVHVFNGDGVALGLLAQCSNCNFDIGEIFALNITQYGYDKALWCGNSHRNVNIITVDDVLEYFETFLIRNSTEHANANIFAFFLHFHRWQRWRLVDLARRMQRLCWTPT